MNDLAQRYDSAAAQSNFDRDDAQRAALEPLARLRDALARVERVPLTTRILRAFASKPAQTPHVRGIYLYGPVGRGKTWLMDLFFESLPFAAKQRRHFHRFMQSVHTGLRTHQRESDPLAAVATDIAATTRVLCLDELFVSDIADAMLLGGLFSHLIERGVTLVCTSNVPPSGLYRDGLQRQRFLPAIALLERHCELVSVDGAEDHRLRRLSQASIYLLASDTNTPATLERLFMDIADHHRRDATTLAIAERTIPVIALSDNVAWFDFDALCEGPRGQEDYIEIAREFRAVIVANVPVFDETSENAARRFIALVDEFYDRRVHLILSAACEPARLYRGTRLVFEFGRTMSRLIEMQSAEYLASEHRA